MSDYMNFQKHTDPSGVLVTAESNGVNARLHFLLNPHPSNVLTPQVDKLKNAVLMFSESAPRLMETLSEKGWKEKAKGELSQVASEFRNLRLAVMDRRNDIEKRRNDLLLPQVPLDPVRAYEIRQFVRTLKPGDAIAFALKDAEIASALVDFKTLSGLSNDMLAHIENATIKNNMAARYAMHVQLKPTAENILASGADVVEANKMAEQAVENFETSLAEVDHVTATLNSTIGFYAIAAIVSRKEAFEMIMS